MDILEKPKEWTEFKKAFGVKTPKPLDKLGEVTASHEKEIDQVRLQDQRRARNAEQARSAAIRAFDPETGELSAEAIETLKDEILRSTEQGIPQSQHMLKMLDLLKDPAFQKEIMEIKAPPEGSPASGLIRASLGMKGTAKVTDTNARQAAVAALLSQLRQADPASCYATSVAIQVQQSNPKGLLRDLKGILSTGKLTREIKGRLPKNDFGKQIDRSLYVLKNEFNPPLNDEQRLGVREKAIHALQSNPSANSAEIAEALTKALQSVTTQVLPVEAACLKAPNNFERQIDKALNKLKLPLDQEGAVRQDVVKALGEKTDADLADIEEALKEALGQRQIDASGLHDAIAREEVTMNIDLSTSDLVKNISLKDVAPGDLAVQPAFRAALRALGIPKAERESKIKEAVEKLSKSRAQAALIAVRQLPDTYPNGEPNWQKIHLMETLPTIVEKSDKPVQEILLEQMKTFAPAPNPAPTIPVAESEQEKMLAEELNATDGRIRAALEFKKALELKTYGPVAGEVEKAIKECEAANAEWEAACNHFDNTKKFSDGLESIFRAQAALDAIERTMLVMDGYQASQVDGVQGTPQDLLAELAGGDPGKQQAATQAFQGQQDNLLLRSWEYSIATLAQVSNGGADLKDPLIEEFKKRLSGAMKGVKSSEEHSKIEKMLTEEFERTIKAATPVFDASKVVRSDDGTSSRGGCVLEIDGEKTDTPARLRKQVAAMAGRLAEKLPKEGKEAEALKEIAKALDSDIEKTWQVGELYVSSTVKAPELLGAFNGVASVNREEHAPTDPADLLKWLLKMNKDIQKQSGDSKELSIPVWNEPHAFSFKVGSPALNSVGSKGESEGEAFSTHHNSEKEKNEAVRKSEFPLTVPLEGKLAKLAEKAVQAINKDWWPDLNDAINKRLEKLQVGKIDKITIQMLAEEIDGALQDLALTNPNDPYWGVRKEKVQDAYAGSLLDHIAKADYESRVAEALVKINVPETEREKIGKQAVEKLTGPSATLEELEQAVKDSLGEVKAELEKLTGALRQPRGVVFGDSNWRDGDHLTLYSMVVNPITDEVEMWSMNEDGTNPKKMGGPWVKSVWGMPKDLKDLGSLV